MNTSDEKTTWRYAGKHRLRDLDGIAVVECCEEIHLSDAQGMTAFFDVIEARHGVFLLLLKLGGGGRPGPAARKHLVDWTGNRRGATACVGGPTTLHVVASLLNRAVRLIHGNAMPMEMFKHEDQAIAWLRSHEKKLRAK